MLAMTGSVALWTTWSSQASSQAYAMSRHSIRPSNLQIGQNTPCIAACTIESSQRLLVAGTYVLRVHRRPAPPGWAGSLLGQCSSTAIAAQALAWKRARSSQKVVTDCTSPLPWGQRNAPPCRHALPATGCSGRASGGPTGSGFGGFGSACRWQRGPFDATHPGCSRCRTAEHGHVGTVVVPCTAACG